MLDFRGLLEAKLPSVPGLVGRKWLWRSLQDWVLGDALEPPIALLLGDPGEVIAGPGLC